MRLQSYLNETIDPSITKDIWTKLTKDCMPFLKELKKSNSPRDKFLYRGFHGGMYSEIQRKKVRADREPSDTPQAIHDRLNKAFKKKFGWNVRSEGAFATSDSQRAGGYGTPFIFFPIGKYKYIWSEEVVDLYQYLGGHHLEYAMNVLYGDYSDIIDDYNIIYGEDNDNGDWYYDGKRLKRYPDGPHVFKELGLTVGEYDKNKLKWVPDVALDDYLKQKKEETIDGFYKSMNRALSTYQTNNMRDAMIAQSEIVFKCKEYYAVKTAYALPLYELMEKEI